MTDNDNTILETCIGVINSKLPFSLININNSNDISIDFIKHRIESYELFLVEIQSLLLDHSILDHQLLWLQSLITLNKLLSVIKLCSKDFLLVVNHGPAINDKLSQFKKRVVGLSIEFLKQDQKLLKKFIKEYQELFQELLNVLKAEELSTTEDFDANILNVIKIILESNYNEYFITIINFNKTIYYLNQSSFLILLPPSYLFAFITNGKIRLSEFIDFYRFTSFNLLSVGQFQEAKAYFKILLDNPTIKLSFYNEENLLIDNKREDKLINLVQRQEISLMYILNYLLSSTSYQNIINSSNLYQKELQFLNKSLSNLLTKEIHQAASQPGSRHSSVLSFQSLTTNNLKYKTHDYLSSIIYDGSYKTKLHNIVEITDVLINFNLPIFFDKCFTIQSSTSYSNCLKQIAKSINQLSLQNLKFNQNLQIKSINDLVDSQINIFKLSKLLNE
ncbi:unnamed protein product [Candida verbasci]|uniref:Uncharacterized protein n=1 Tax=Candida verbasci TaxID=1227364 RepID=A0A9W4TV67_9ASCO|nr:unnamed protein product [Candida verbasci]